MSETESRARLFLETTEYWGDEKMVNLLCDFFRFAVNPTTTKKIAGRDPIEPCSSDEL